MDLSKLYPKWKYHRTLPACVVPDPQAEAALGEGWANTPAAFAEPETLPEPEAPAYSPDPGRSDDNLPDAPEKPETRAQMRERKKAEKAAAKAKEK